MKNAVCRKKAPAVSVIVPVYHTEQYLARCLESIGHQSFRDLEILVVNDASPGRIREMIHRWMRKDPRIRFLDSNEHEGLLAARLRGAAEAKGTYIAFVDSDDYISFDYLRSMHALAIRDDADITFAMTVREDGDARYTWPVHDAMIPHSFMTGEDARKYYFEQELSIYAWHTVWNKLYHRRLWEKSLPFLESVRKPCVMGEDILISTVLFGYAERVTGAADSVYFYCVNRGASTDPESMTPHSFSNNIRDLSFVFTAAGRFLEESGADPGSREHILNARGRYARMWGNLLEKIPFSAGEKMKAKSLLRGLRPAGVRQAGKVSVLQDDWFAESIRQPWSGRLEYIRRRVAFGKEKVIGFDIFGTLLERPLENPEDLFLLMEGIFRKLGGNGHFAALRKEAEKIARKKAGSRSPSRDDITLEEIYSVMGQEFRLSDVQTGKLMEEELKLERQLLSVRETGLSLLELARAAGKRVILISDMYMTRSIVNGILSEKGIRGYENIWLSSEYGRLKGRGDLFRCALNEMGISAGEMLFIGDSWDSDIEGSRAAGIESVFLPSWRDAMMNRIRGCNTGRCGMLGMRGGLSQDVCESNGRNPGYRMMKAMAGRRFFDNPYRDFMKGSDLGCDLRMAGYYTGGMHLLGIARFIDKEVRRSKAGCVHFLARDGCLPMKAYKLFLKYTNTPVRTGYLPASRRMLMPVILRKKEDFADIPARIGMHTPESITKILDFAFEGEEAGFADKLREAGIPWNKPFRDLPAYRRYLEIFFSGWYSSGNHREAIRSLRQYYQSIKPGDLLFDIGYSGRIPEAISFLTGFGVDTLFIHDDHEMAGVMQERGGFRILTMYPHRPRVSGLVREFFLSDPRPVSPENGSREDGGGVSSSAPGLMIIGKWQEEALAFVKDFMHTFGDRLDEIDWSPLEVSLPFEEYLRHMTEPDRALLAACRSDDSVYGGKEVVNIKDLLEEIYRDIDPEEINETESGEPAARTALREVLKYYKKPARAMILAVADRNLFREKLAVNLKNGRDTLRRVIS